MVVMHISDLHFGVKDNSNGTHIKNREMVLTSFLECLSTLPKDLLPDILVISGDVGFSGKNEEYNKAKTYILEILDRLNGKLTIDDIIICPGNHDVNIPNDRRVEVRPTKDKLDTSDLEELTRDNIHKSAYKFNNYYLFLKTLGIKPLINQVKEVKSKCLKYLYGYRFHKGIHFIILNSEWDFGGKNDYSAEGCLRLGADLVADTFEQIAGKENDNEPIIAVFHRPLDPYIHISERNQYNKKDLRNVEYRLNTGVDIILNGHVHTSRADGLGLRAWRFSCGTIHSNDIETPEFWIFRFEDNYYKSFKYKWCPPNSRYRNGYWKKDVDDDYNEKVWILGENKPNYLSTEDLNELDKIIDKYQQKKISEEEVICFINEKFSKNLKEIIANLFNKAINNSIKYKKTIENHDGIGTSYEKNLELKFSETVDDNQVKNNKEDKNINE